MSEEIRICDECRFFYPEKSFCKESNKETDALSSCASWERKDDYGDYHLSSLAGEEGDGESESAED